MERSGKRGRKRILKTFNNTENHELLPSDLNNVELLRNL